MLKQRVISMEGILAAGISIKKILSTPLRENNCLKRHGCPNNQGGDCSLYFDKTCLKRFTVKEGVKK